MNHLCVSQTQLCAKLHWLEIGLLQLPVYLSRLLFVCLFSVSLRSWPCLARFLHLTSTAPLPFHVQIILKVQARVVLPQFSVFSSSSWATKVVFSLKSNLCPVACESWSLSAVYLTLRTHLFSQSITGVCVLFRSYLLLVSFIVLLLRLPLDLSH